MMLLNRLNTDRWKFHGSCQAYDRASPSTEGSTVSFIRSPMGEDGTSETSHPRRATQDGHPRTRRSDRRRHLIVLPLDSAMVVRIHPLQPVGELFCSLVLLPKIWWRTMATTSVLGVRLWRTQLLLQMISPGDRPWTAFTGGLDQVGVHLDVSISKSSPLTYVNIWCIVGMRWTLHWLAAAVAAAAAATGCLVCDDAFKPITQPRLPMQSTSAKHFLVSSFADIEGRL